MNHNNIESKEYQIIVYILKMFPRLSETFIVNEIRHLEKAGFKIHVYSLKKPVDPKSLTLIKEIKAPIIYLPDSFNCDFLAYLKKQFLFLFRSPFKYILCLFYTINKLKWIALKRFFQAVCLAEDIKDKAVIHIHAGFAHSPATVALIQHRLTGLPFSFTAHAKDLYLSEEDSLKNKITQSKFVITCTQYNKVYLDNLVTREFRDKIFKIYHGIQSDRFHHEKQSHRKHLRILSIGRLVEKKGHSYLIDSCKILQDRGYQFECHIVGGGLLREFLEEQIKKYQLENIVQLHGAKTQDELMDYYKKAAIFVTPCIISSNNDRDGIPNVLMEAMSMELPVIASEISGIPELIENGINGILVPEKDSHQLADAIAKLIDQPEYRIQLAQNGRKTIVYQFDSTIHSEKLIKLIHEEIFA